MRRVCAASEEKQRFGESKSIFANGLRKTVLFLILENATPLFCGVSFFSPKQNAALSCLRCVRFWQKRKKKKVFFCCFFFFFFFFFFLKNFFFFFCCFVRNVFWENCEKKRSTKISFPDFLFFYFFLFFFF